MSTGPLLCAGGTASVVAREAQWGQRTRLSPGVISFLMASAYFSSRETPTLQFMCSLLYLISFSLVVRSSTHAPARQHTATSPSDAHHERLSSSPSTSRGLERRSLQAVHDETSPSTRTSAATPLVLRTISSGQHTSIYVCPPRRRSKAQDNNEAPIVAEAPSTAVDAP